MSKHTVTQSRYRWLRPVLVAVLGILVAYALVHNWSAVRASFRIAQTADVGWMVLALLLMTCTFCIAAAVYVVLALHRLRYYQAVLIEIAAAFMNRLLPSGIGGLGLHGVYLYRQKHSGAEATAVVTVNNLIGVLAHVLLLVVVTTIRPSVVSELHFDGDRLVTWQALLAAVGVVLLVLAIPPVRQRGAVFVRRTLVAVQRIRPWRLVRAFAIAMALTVTYTLVLGATTRALDIGLSLLQVFIVFSAGMLAATATPTPGGLVGAEAGLFAGFVAYGVPAASAGGAVLLYRLVTYWIPLLPGALALYVARRRELL